MVWYGMVSVNFPMAVLYASSEVYFCIRPFLVKTEKDFCIQNLWWESKFSVPLPDRVWLIYLLDRGIDVMRVRVNIK